MNEWNLTEILENLENAAYLVTETNLNEGNPEICSNLSDALDHISNALRSMYRAQIEWEN